MSTAGKNITISGPAQVALYACAVLVACAFLWLLVIRFDKSHVSGFTGFDIERNSKSVASPRAELRLLEGGNWEVRSGGQPIGIAIMSVKDVGPYTFTVQSTTRQELYKGLVFSIVRGGPSGSPMQCPECLQSTSLNKVLPIVWYLSSDVVTTR